MCPQSLIGPDSGGNILEQYEYDAFGWPYFLDASGNAIGAYDPVQNLWEGYSLFGNRLLFTGREWIPDLKLYDYRNRMYQPELGRFLQPDPKEFAAGDYNLYRYCHNDPVNKSDPMGLYWDVQDFNGDDNWKIWQMIERLEKMPGPIGETFRQLSASDNRMVVIPIQNTAEGQKKWNVPPRDVGDNRNRTTPQDEADAENGNGTGSRIEFDPNNYKDPENRKRDPIEGFGHEGRHGAANDKGERLTGTKQEEDRARDFQKLIRKELEKKR
jgi:RHS repeat-associated protein